jgi:hypothetical protein
MLIYFVRILCFFLGKLYVNLWMSILIQRRKKKLSYNETGYNLHLLMCLLHEKKMLLRKQNVDVCNQT